MSGLSFQTTVHRITIILGKASRVCWSPWSQTFLHRDTRYDSLSRVSNLVVAPCHSQEPDKTSLEALVAEDRDIQLPPVWLRKEWGHKIRQCFFRWNCPVELEAEPYVKDRVVGSFKATAKPRRISDTVTRTTYSTPSATAWVIEHLHVQTILQRISHGRWSTGKHAPKWSSHCDVVRKLQQKNHNHIWAKLILIKTREVPLRWFIAVPPSKWIL